MIKETRANLIFLTIFLGVSIPGAVILVIKKSDPLAGRMALPDSVRRRVPYMTPINAPEGKLTRYIPPLTGQWVRRVAREQGGVDPVATRHWRPIISDDYIVQLIGVRPGKAAGTTTVLLIAWDHPYSADMSRYTVSAKSDSRDVPARLAAARSLELPKDVRKEVMGGGFAAAPAHVTWLEVDVDVDPNLPVATRPPLTLHLSHPAAEGAQPADSSVNVFTNEAFDPK
jgi:hypothetical protein